MSTCTWNQLMKARKSIEKQQRNLSSLNHEEIDWFKVKTTKLAKSEKNQSTQSFAPLGISLTFIQPTFQPPLSHFCEFCKNKIETDIQGLCPCLVCGLLLFCDKCSFKIDGLQHPRFCKKHPPENYKLNEPRDKLIKIDFNCFNLINSLNSSLNSSLSDKVIIPYQKIYGIFSKHFRFSKVFEMKSDNSKGFSRRDLVKSIVSVYRKHLKNFDGEKNNKDEVDEYLSAMDLMDVDQFHSDYLLFEINIET